MRATPAFVLSVGLLSAADPTAIMRQVAANHERASDVRRHYIYQQKVRGRLVRSDGKPAREEIREYRATPGPQRTEKELTSFQGRYYKDKKAIPYDRPGFEYKDVDVDGELIDDLIDDLVDDKESRDGIPHSLFPLAVKDLDKYRFTDLGQSSHQGRPALRIGFEPAPGRRKNEDGRAAWKGEILVDAEELQPVRVYTDLAWKVPFAVRTFLGTDLRQTGFSLSYTRVAENVWFPSSYGAEFRFSVLFAYKRTITLAMESSDFRRAEVESAVRYDPVPE